MKEIIEFAPAIIAAIMFFIQYKLFMTPADFEREKADFMKYIAEHYVSDKTYRDNHNSLEKKLTDLEQKNDSRFDRVDEKIDGIRDLIISKMN